MDAPQVGANQAARVRSLVFEYTLYFDQKLQICRTPGYLLIVDPLAFLN